MQLRKNKYLFLKNLLNFGFVFIFMFSVLFSVFVVSSPNMTYAADGGGGNAGNNADGGGGNAGDDNVNIDVKINNPLGNISSIPQFIEALLNIVITIGVPIVALAIIYTGFLFVTAQGKPDKLTTAKKALTFTLIGAALLLGAWVLANAIVGTVEQIRSEAN